MTCLCDGIQADIATDKAMNYAVTATGMRAIRERLGDLSVPEKGPLPAVLGVDMHAGRAQCAAKHARRLWRRQDVKTRLIRYRNVVKGARAGKDAELFTTSLCPFSCPWV